MKKKEKISAIYRNQVLRIVDTNNEPGYPESLGPGEAEEIWEEISGRLDIEEVWEKISAGLDTIMPHPPRPGLFYKYCAAVFVILALMVHVEKTPPADDPGSQRTSAIIQYADQESVLNSQNYSVGNPVSRNSPEHATPNIQIKPTAAKISGMLVSSQNENSINEAVISGEAVYNRRFAEQTVQVPEDTQPPELAVSNYQQGGQPAEGEVANKNRDPDNLTISFHHQPEIRKLTGLSHSSAAREGETGKSLKSMSQLMYLSKFTGGFITSFRNTWLLNQETFDGLRSESLNTTEIVIFPDAGLSLGYMLTRQLTVQTDAFLYSSTGQGYQEYIFGKYSRKKIVLRYSTVVASLKYNTRGPAGNPDRSSINLSAGAYISFLHNADQRINADVQKVSSSYRKLDFGTRLSGEFEFHLNEYISVAPGLNLTLGLTNIYKGNAQIPGYLRNTHNASAGLQLSFYWIMD